MTLEENTAICQQIVERKQQQQRQMSQRLLNDHQITPNQQIYNINNQYIPLNTPRTENLVGTQVII